MTSNKTAHLYDNCFVIIPLFNDYVSCLKLIERIDDLKVKTNFKIIIVDDASTDLGEHSTKLRRFKPKKRIESIKILQLETNLGVNGAIHEGLLYAFRSSDKNDLFMIMDSDGEDSPDDIEQLLNNHRSSCLVVAKRQGFTRTISFNLWRIIFITVMKLTTKKMVNFGNFSLFDFNVCKQLIHSKHIGLSYVGAVLALRLPIIKVPIKRAQRYDGKSVSGRFGQFIFGFQIMSCFIDVVFSRILQLCLGFLLLNFFGIIMIMYLKFFSLTTVPGWASLILVTLTTSSLQLIFTLAMLILIFLHIQRLHSFVKVGRR